MRQLSTDDTVRWCIGAFSEAAREAVLEIEVSADLCEINYDATLGFVAFPEPVRRFGRTTIVPAAFRIRETVPR